jgi:hypothetical protein
MESASCFVSMMPPFDRFHRSGRISFLLIQRSPWVGIARFSALRIYWNSQN